MTDQPRTAAGRALLDSMTLTDEERHDWTQDILAIEAQARPAVASPHEHEWMGIAFGDGREESHCTTCQEVRPLQGPRTSSRPAVASEGLREALRSVEWGQIDYNDSEFGGEAVAERCPRCQFEKPGPHHPECPVGLALASDADSVGALDVARQNVIDRLLDLNKFATWSALNRPEYPPLREALAEYVRVAAAYDAERQEES